MTAQILDGKSLAQTMQAELAHEVTKFVEQTGVRPGLATVLVGENHPGRLYVRNKHRACETVGIVSHHHELAGNVSPEEMLRVLAALNQNPAIHGILVQLPLPRHLDEDVIIQAVDPLKDVDGFGTVSLGMLTAGRPRFFACTPYGVMMLLSRNDIKTSGKHAVIVGRSNIVGKPLAMMLSQKGVDATVTLCHSRTADVGAHTRLGDIVIMAIGQAGFLRADMVKPGAVVIDVGMNRREDHSWTGDVDYPAVAKVASAITPVPGGVGPMTITMLLYNTLHAARLQRLQTRG